MIFAAASGLTGSLYTAWEVRFLSDPPLGLYERGHA